MSKTSPTAAGPTNQNPQGQTAHGAHIDAINQVFALFRVNFHNQYYAAFSDTQLLNQTKKLWLESLCRFSQEAILRGAKRAIEKSDYLPTLHKMIQFCQGDPAQLGLPEPHQAYVEACHATSPKTNYSWSHPAVYFAGRDSNWFFLASNPEYVAFPVFKEHYERWTQRALNGETLPKISVKQLSHDTETPLTKTENQQKLKSLRDQFRL